MKFDEDEAKEIYQILVREAGAPAHNIGDFAFFVASSSGCEYRFQGDLGFGGKFWNTSKKIWVSCYDEHKNATRTEIIRRTNEALFHFMVSRLERNGTCSHCSGRTDRPGFHGCNRSVHPARNLAQSIVEDIELDLTDRRGFDFCSIDKDVHYQIRDAWESIINRHLQPKE